MMALRLEVLAFLAGVLVTAAAAPWDSSMLVKTLAYDWNGDFIPENWSPVFADYNTAVAAEGMNATVATVHQGNAHNASVEGYYFSVSNRADDVYFGLKGYVTGLAKKKKYNLAFDLYIYSNAGEGCLGIGGSPGESVWVKAGASKTEPTVSFQGGTWRFSNINKGEQSISGPAGSVLGNVAVPQGGCSDAATNFFPKSFLNYKHADPITDEPYNIKSSHSGSLWLLAGFESGFEGINKAYITKLVVYLYRAS